jgi:hypothetical protein
MGCGAASMQRQAAFRGWMPGAVQPAIAGGIHAAPKWRVAMPATPWLASVEAGREASKYK